MPTEPHQRLTQTLLLSYTIYSNLSSAEAIHQLTIHQLTADSLMPEGTFAMTLIQDGNLFNTYWLLIITGIVKYIPFASRSSLNSMLQLSGEIEAAEKGFVEKGNKDQFLIMQPVFCRFNREALRQDALHTVGLLNFIRCG